MLTKRNRPFLASGSVGAAVSLALYGTPYAVLAQQAPAAVAQPEVLQEVVVTATRREQALESVPYSISVVSADALNRTGVTDLINLQSQVPGLSQFDFGARSSASTTPVLRGLNASGAQPNTRAFRSLEQSPVGTYIGNSPFEGYIQLDDVQRIEVLRGPQGTLYGAGSLGGALRVIPNDPQLNSISASVEAGVSNTAHASDPGYLVTGVLNIPVGDTLALRAAARFDSEPGFIDAFGLLKRRGPALTAVPDLADPNDPANSAGIFYNKDDWNRQDTFTGRASLLWKPADRFQANLAFIYGNLNGEGGPTPATAYRGGPDPVDPRHTLPAGGDYRTYSAIEQPYWRRTRLASLDVSFDAGFATLSSTTSYAAETGSTVMDSSNYGALKYFAGYYAGNPVNPRYIAPQVYEDKGHTLSEEVRLVSRSGPTMPVDYTLGLFYSHRNDAATWNITSPGTYARSVAQGCTADYYLGAVFPACLPPAGPSDLNWSQLDKQVFEDRSVFGELSWRFASNAQVTVGARHFRQSFDDLSYIQNPTFATVVPPASYSAPASKNTWKINLSYEFATGHHVYALWSQGFRRGGANPLPSAGIYKENPQFDTYAPDSVDNYELGIKGKSGNGLRYTFAMFDVEWKDPQISTTLPAGTVAVINGTKARSRGFEFDLSGPLVLDGLTFVLGGSYADAKLTTGFSYAANKGTGSIQPGLVTSAAGEQLPGSPKISAAATLNYVKAVGSNSALTTTLNVTGRSYALLELQKTDSPTTPGFALLNLSVVLTHDAWDVGLYGTNITDRRVIVWPAVPSALLPPLGQTPYKSDNINTPRQVTLRVGYAFEGSGK